MPELSPINQKKARRRNIVPARIGYFALFYMCVYGSILIILYMIPIEVGKEQESAAFHKIKNICKTTKYFQVLSKSMSSLYIPHCIRIRNFRIYNLDLNIQNLHNLYQR